MLRNEASLCCKMLRCLLPQHKCRVLYGLKNLIEKGIQKYFKYLQSALPFIFFLFFLSLYFICRYGREPSHRSLGRKRFSHGLPVFLHSFILPQELPVV